MLKLNDLRIDPISLGHELLLVDIMPCYAYINGNKTDSINGYCYVVAMPEHNLEKIGVKIAGKKLMERPKIEYNSVRNLLVGIK
jgi:hypothetical protein